jgi:hypothetical protein
VDPPAHADREQRILSLWERAVGRPRWHRDDALLRDAGAPPALGDRNRALLAIRNALFSRDWALTSACPGCDTVCEFAVDGVALAEGLDARPPADSDTRFDWHGRPIAVREPTVDDLRGIANQGDVAGAVRALLARCLPGDIDPARLSEDEIDALGAWIESLDPAAAVMFALTCPACGGEWPAPLDVAEALWAEVQRAAELALTDVDALARAYGWTEDQVMGLSPVRRAAYLQLVAAP